MLLLTLSFLLLCPTDTPALEPQVAVQSVLQQALTYPALTQFLTPLHHRKLAFHYYTLPLYNQYYLPQPTADVVLPDQRRVLYTNPTTPQPKPHQALISVARLVIDQDSAFVTLGIVAEGVVGRFRLGRTATHHWRVVKAEVYEI